MSVMVMPRVKVTQEDLDLAFLREAYVEGRIDVEAFEHRVWRVLRGESNVVPMGLPAFETEDVRR